MANQEQLNILKQGVDAWNLWRIDNSHIEIDLVEADLKEIDLKGANLRDANLYGAELYKVDLSGANLSGANLDGADFNLTFLEEANLARASLTRTFLINSFLRGANLSNTFITYGQFHISDLDSASFHGAHFSKSLFDTVSLIMGNLEESNISYVIFDNVNLSRANLSETTLGGSTFSSADFNNTTGLETVVHHSASKIGTDTLLRSKGRIPEEFLRGCGLSDWEIETAKLYNPELTNDERSEILYKIHDIQAKQPIQISPLFISYSHADSSYVDRIEKSLNNKGIRFWRDKHEMKAGRIEKQIDRAIRQNPTVLLVLSENSIQSDWVEHEVRLARKLEKDTKRDVLCPVALDDSWKNSPWPERIMEQITEYNVLDFSDWEDDGYFEKTFEKLIDGLNLYYKK